jgi:hypothetical protein
MKRMTKVWRQILNRMLRDAKASGNESRRMVDPSSAGKLWAWAVYNAKMNLNAEQPGSKGDVFVGFVYAGELFVLVSKGKQFILTTGIW